MIQFPARLRPRALLVLGVLWSCVLLSGPGFAEQGATTGFFDQTFGDFSEEIKNAKEQGKKGVFIMFEMENCPYCLRMRTTVLNRPEVQAFYRANFLTFPIDIEGAVEVTDFAGRPTTQKDFARLGVQVRATPTFAFFDLTGNLIAKYAGATDDAQEFMWLGDYVVSGRYEDTPFPVYRRERQDAAAKPGAAG
ncbi:MAG TPA: thioredoxin family protein [Lamprocystis sp. (in: g-proteobacteria)]|nr:thioredoxin family protein [Lamprocystis sp. (in: g-proteobacteria)]